MFVRFFHCLHKLLNTSEQKTTLWEFHTVAILMGIVFITRLCVHASCSDRRADSVSINQKFCASEWIRETPFQDFKPLTVTDLWPCGRLLIWWIYSKLLTGEYCSKTITLPFLPPGRQILSLFEKIQQVLYFTNYEP